MRVIVVGAGEVGRAIATNLEQSHDVVVIDRNEETVEELTYSLDVLALRGDGTELETLREAGVEQTDLVIACTDSDETNLVVCGSVKTVTDAFTIARVRRRTLLETWEGAQSAFGVDFMVCTDLLTAQAIFRICGLPAAQDVDMFAGGLVRMAEFHIRPESPVANESIQEADRYDSLTFAGIFRDDELIVATGETVIQPDDRLVVIGSPDSVAEFAADATTAPDDDLDEIVIIGGSEIGYQAALEFESHGYSPRLIEQDPDRARELAEALPDTLVLESDATDLEFLAREHVDEADVIVAALDSDEKNLLVSLLGRRLGVDRTIAVIENLEYADLFQRVGIDVAVNPREETAEEIVRFTRTRRAEKVVMLEHDRAEVIEFEVDADSALLGDSIEEVVAELPDGVVVGAISRGGKRITPRGTTVVQPGDHVVLFVDARVLEEVLEAI
ncbi:Trk system potassium transporter TrkA [Natrarchaeobaculum aegyptiacum]|uniref:Trk system potassium transport protein TrkA n=1 Tax=Natrarchaeobaculum aegyptiacum TaxID=745377 RepID=A0A2Z2HX84_9EURY|nr:Trk system potassium transporter TrkA [Natrarchaeobaculum aegyptiacum]ARS91880.1 Trk system potassium transport protein TrkA [Natrarchaeobaculum aegyptiacum]